MEDHDTRVFPLAMLHTQRDISLLDDIDELRSQGINHYVSLPQLVVCGDQSSGKSSVLEAISGIPFPTKDNLCTRFATEVVLRRSPRVNVDVTIIPGPDRSESEKAQLLRFQGSLDSLDSIATIVEDARDAMGLDTSRSAFADDTLRVEISGPDQQHLTVVDLPGLIHSENKMQSATDVKLVQDLVQRYITNGRSIILAIVSAKNDYANQIVLKMAREVDRDGIRTLGIITKPDTLPAGSESEMAFIDLANNHDVEFRLGWHVLRNRDCESRTASIEDRDRNEADFFSQNPWRELPRDNVGVSTLRPKLSKVLLDQIKAELPSLLSEVENGIEDCRAELSKLGSSRTTTDEQRLFLLNLGQEFQSVAKDAVDGVYEDTFFGDSRSSEGYSKRLRAVIQNLNLEFAEAMRLRGHYYQIVSKPNQKPCNPGRPKPITRSAFLDHTHELLKRNRGRELPGMFNPLIVGDLFFEQAQPWEGLAQAHLTASWDAARVFLELALSHLADSKTSEALLKHFVDPVMDAKIHRMRHKLKELLTPYQRGHPITYNHYFTENVQKVRVQRMETEIASRLQKFLGLKEGSQLEELNITKIKKSNLVSALSMRTEADMDIYACSEALDCMMAYYKVALKTMVDNVTVHCVEMGLISQLCEVFSPARVIQLDPGMVNRIAEESSETMERRDHLKRRLNILKAGVGICRRHLLRKPIALSDVQKPFGIEIDQGHSPPLEDNEILQDCFPVPEHAITVPVEALTVESDSNLPPDLNDGVVAQAEPVSPSPLFLGKKTKKKKATVVE